MFSSGCLISVCKTYLFLSRHLAKTGQFGSYRPDFDWILDGHGLKRTTSHQNLKEIRSSLVIFRRKTKYYQSTNRVKMKVRQQEIAESSYDGRISDRSKKEEEGGGGEKKQRGI